MGGDINSASDSGSASNGANQPGQAAEFTVEDQNGNPVAGVDVHLSAPVAGTPSATANIGLVDLGEDKNAETGGNDDVVVCSDAEGKVKVWVADSAAEVVVLTARPNSNTSALAISNQGTVQVTFS